jgi:DNA-directed RNA polymerase subunit M/transcription elongation factor TFIIS
MALENACRIVIRKKLFELLNEHDQSNSHTEKEKIANDLEKGIYNQSVKFARQKHIDATFINDKFREVYKMYSKRVCVNLHKYSYIRNKDLINQIFNNEIIAEKVGEFTPQELYPTQWKSLIEDKNKKDKHMNTMTAARITEEFRCRKCGHRKCSYNEVQTRSADEAMTLMLKCLNCGNRWNE